MPSRLRPFVLPSLLTLGLTLVTVGVWDIYRPAGLIAAGLSVVAVTVEEAL